MLRWGDMGTGSRVVDVHHRSAERCGDGSRESACRHLRANVGQERQGARLGSDLLALLKRKAARAGFNRWIRARGLWVLSDGRVQVEDIWIGRAARPDGSTRLVLSKLAAFIKKVANQEAVAWEECGELRFL